MSDQVWLQLHVSARDVATIAATDLREADEKDRYDKHTALLHYNEVNLAGHDYIKELAELGLSFTGHHGEGPGHNSESFVACDEEVMYYAGDEQELVSTLVFDDPMLYRQEKARWEKYKQLRKEVNRQHDTKEALPDNG